MATNTQEAPRPTPAPSTGHSASRTATDLQFRDLLLSSLPSHPDLPGATTDPTTFLTRVLGESGPALAAVFSGPAHTVKVLSTSKASPPADARVTLRRSRVALEEGVGQADGGKGTEEETWYSRESKHAAKAARGTASYAEFEEGLFVNHTEREAEYTEDIFDANLLVDWGWFRGEGRVSDGFEEVQMKLWEVYHKIPLISNRVFDTLVISAKYADKSRGSFLTLQLPVDTTSLPKELLDRRSHRQGSRHRKEVAGGDGEKVKWEPDCDVVLGKYVSMEYVDGETTPGEVLWRMALISDAGGKLPLALQNFSLPGKVAQDVGLFMKWVDGRRNGPT